jgi:hypothetical protein
MVSEMSVTFEQLILLIIESQSGTISKNYIRGYDIPRASCWGADLH